MKLKQELRALKNLYDLLPKPDIPCVDGCSACCGPVPTTRAEARMAPKLREFSTDPDMLYDAVVNHHDCGNCPYVEAKGYGCAIYDERPFLCRLYGLTDDPGLSCRYGPRTTRPLTKAQTNLLMQKFFRIYLSDPETEQEYWQIKANWALMRDMGFKPRGE